MSRMRRVLWFTGPLVVIVGCSSNGPTGPATEMGMIVVSGNFIDNEGTSHGHVELTMAFESIEQFEDQTNGAYPSYLLKTGPVTVTAQEQSELASDVVNRFGPGRLYLRYTRGPAGEIHFYGSVLPDKRLIRIYFSAEVSDLYGNAGPPALSGFTADNGQITIIRDNDEARTWVNAEPAILHGSHIRSLVPELRGRPYN